jgi:hypothetical protein
MLAMPVIFFGYALGWNIPGHMVSGAIAYQILRAESPTTIATVKAILEKHPWYENHWKDQLDKVSELQRDELLFMLSARWADDIRTRDRSQHRGQWHYINFAFKPNGQPSTVQIKPPESVNITTALAENERVAKSHSDPGRKAIALTWLFHLVGDIHQPLHSAQIFTTGYPDGDRGGNLVCVRAKESTQAINLHRFWDGIITTSSNITRLNNDATTLRNRSEFAKRELTELASIDYEAWVKESFEIATTITYQNGAIGTPKGKLRECSELSDAKVLPIGYARVAGVIADRRIMLSGYRLADLLKRIFGN